MDHVQLPRTSTSIVIHCLFLPSTYNRASRLKHTEDPKEAQWPNSTCQPSVSLCQNVHLSLLVIMYIIYCAKKEYHDKSISVITWLYLWFLELGSTLICKWFTMLRPITWQIILTARGKEGTSRKRRGVKTAPLAPAHVVLLEHDWSRCPLMTCWGSTTCHRADYSRFTRQVTLHCGGRLL